MKDRATVLGLVLALVLAVVPTTVFAGSGSPGAWGSRSGLATPGVREQPGVFGTTPDPWANWPPRPSRDGFGGPRAHGHHHDGFGSPGMRAEPRQDLVWVPGFWSWTAYGWAWVPGYWGVAVP